MIQEPQRAGHVRKAKIALLLFAAAALAVALPDQPLQRWITHSSFADFSRGTLGDGGANVYVARSGGVQMIHRLDFNNDGYLDLFLGQDHNTVENEDVLIYWGSPTGPRSLLPELTPYQPLGRLLREIRARENVATRLPSGGGGRSLVVDLNGDGYPEIVFCNFIHNYSVHMNAYIYWGGPDGYSPERRTELPTLLASGVAAADFNGDGYIDLAFANRGIEGGERFGFDQNLESYVYWNGPTGFSPERRSSLPTVSAIDCAAADWNGDGYPDLLFLNNNSQEKSLYLYWGGRQGFSEKRREVRKGGDPGGARVADLNGDGKPDLILTHQNDRAEIFLGTGNGIEAKPWAVLPTARAVEARVADLNKDGYPDIVFANQGTGAEQASYIYWGSAQGYSPERRTSLPTLHATDAALADFNGDGWIDIVFANEHDGKTYDAPSYLYWNGPTGFDPARRTDLQGFGAVNAQAADLNGDGHPDLVLINRNSGRVGPMDSFIYWGNAAHDYSPASMTALPGTENTVATAADLDQNGWVDLVFPNGRIYWNGPQGFSAERRQDLGVQRGSGVTVADLNRDGYLDLIFSAGGVHVPGLPSTAWIYWGGPSGYRPENRTALRLDTRITLAPRVVDLNKDGYLDLIFPDVDSENLDIVWGDASGRYSMERKTLLEVQSAASVEIADLNGDGWLDLILGGGWDRKRFGRPTRQATLLWGSPQGYSPQRATHLEAFDSLEQVVADLNKDGYLDIVMSNYHAYTTRTLPAFIYWGGPAGYSESRRTSLPAESSSALTVADFNQDGWLDIVVCNHVASGDHGVGTNIFWGGKDGYSWARRQWIPSFGPHFSLMKDLGNIYHRRLEEEYVSPALECPAGLVPARLGWKARTPHGTAVKFQIRTARSKTELARGAWRGPQGSTYYEHPGAALAVPRDHGWLQYRAVFTSPDGGSTAFLDEVHVDAAARK